MPQLPDEIPIFPLPNVVLFPHTDLPLHIFEPRYREMVTDAMAGDRLIGMVLLRGDWRRDYHATPDVFALGCVGRIETFDELDDGRSNLVLRGVARFDITGEIAGRTYRRARVAWREEDELGMAEEIGDLNARLRAAVERLLARREREAPADLWSRLPRGTGLLVNTLASVLDLSPIEKLALLECDDVRSRTGRFLEVLEFRLAASGTLADAAGDDEPRH
ncbi:LON peptidase substrate-binding domain-containing protein [Candidatus Binatia bacterium]|nr:LON peptidase substrate-binding domain-containing protein [Candidatus Binatia bacterium]